MSTTLQMAFFIGESKAISSLFDYISLKKGHTRRIKSYYKGFFNNMCTVIILESLFQEECLSMLSKLPERMIEISERNLVLFHKR